MTISEIVKRNIRIRLAVLDKNFSDVARAISISRTSMHRLYNDPLSGRKLERWAEYLGVPVSVLIARDAGVIASFDVSTVEIFDGDSKTLSHQ